MNDFSRFINDELNAIINEKHDTIIRLIHLVENETDQLLDAIDSHAI